jgi:hypothetical protein
LKRVDARTDWIMRRTQDTSAREAQFAASPLVQRLPAGVGAPYLGAARDGDGWVVLMHDVSPWLFPPDGVLPAETADVILRRLAEMHAHFWEKPLDDVDIDWCPSSVRLYSFAPDVATRLQEETGHAFFEEGWAAFEKHAPHRARELVQHLCRDGSRLLADVESLPRTLVHGDAKIANMALAPDGVLWMFDWSIVGSAPVAVELMLFLTINSSRFPWSVAETAERYRGHLEQTLGDRFPGDEWQLQRDITAAGALLLYGWGKALDATNGKPDELRWWCEQAVAAADRRGW